MLNKSIYPLMAGLLAFALTNPGTSLAGEGEQLARRIFNEVERQLILDYYHERFGRPLEQDAYGGGSSNKGKKGGKQKGMPPGLAKRDRLPPGLEKQLKRNGHLPPGLEKKALPPSLARQLPPVPRGYERVVVDNDVLLIELASGLIVDILHDVF